MTSLNKFLNSNMEGSYFIGHACVLCRINGKLLAIDFLKNKNFFLDSWFFFPKLEWHAKLIKKLDYVFISHCHDDHYDPIFLKKLPKKIKIFIPDQRIGFEKIKLYNKKNLFKIKPNKIYKVDQNINVLALPSDHNKIDTSYIIRGDKFSVYHGNDNFLSPQIVKKATKKYGSVDHAYVPFAYVWWYPFCLKSISKQKRISEGIRLSAKSMKIGAQIATALQPKKVIPFAANMVYYDPKNSINNEIANTFDFSAYCKKNYKFLSKKIVNLFPGDYILNKSNRDTSILKKNNKKIFFKKLNKFLNNMGKNFNNEYRDLKFEGMKQLINNYNKNFFKKKSKELNRSLNIIIDNDKENLIQIDTIKKKLIIKKRIKNKYEKNVYQFKFENKPLVEWLKGKVSFEDILNSQRFQLKRNPEEFNKKLWSYIRENL